MSSETNYKFEPQDYGMVLNNVAGVAVNSQGNLYALVRGEVPVLIFNSDGQYVGGWGKGLIGGPHGIFIDSDDFVYCVDSKQNIVMKFSPDGQLLLTLGTAGESSDSGCIGGDFKTVTQGAGPFNKPTNAATSPSGDIFVSDGYGNARVHRFSADGTLIKSWGEPGYEPGQFHLPHGIAVDQNSLVYVADRENDRIQIFDIDGNLQAIWENLYRPTDICIKDGFVYVSEVGHRMYIDNVLFKPSSNPPWSQIRVFDLAGVEKTRIGGPEGWKAGNFFAAHSICVDQEGSIYVGEVIWPAHEISTPEDLHHALQKFRRL
ncbi:peptidyl-alpha-hydroxyglycine alpha-amidating lyase family protein [Paenibacillus sp. WQ 127069]|uniref:Peptidyl-alpha-hydroxyglycine alpha-amidating lyase family protein n=1 Tax=Paenibacillus baimaensis TaxID=2982185 RepID=A0ABT2UGM9_9BACL|nr:peptidyl-alpha-hydroxyglycine alpha-amidating lyase family protein [Paenibacillus sp. WQ 127069]MCU6793196.1 peptidyl-alpha-hydroxyglycine alpha-amidating lyase family protein [Paenibacillus sp. WQ 127069]